MMPHWSRLNRWRAGWYARQTGHFGHAGVLLGAMLACGGDAGLASATETPKASATANLVGHGGPVRALAAAPGKNWLLSGSFDNAMMLWEVNKDGAARALKRFDDHDKAVSAVAFHPDGKHGLAASDDGALHIWDLVSGRHVHVFKGHTAKILGLAIGPRGRWAATASWDRTVRVWDLESRQPAGVFKGHTGPVNAVAFSSDGTQLISAGYDGTLRLWQRAPARHQRVAYKHGWGINVLKRVGDRDQFVFGSLDGAAGIFDLSANKVVHMLARHDKPVLSIAAIAQPGLLATSGGDGVIHVYRHGDWKLLESYKSTYGPIWATAFTLRGARIYYGGLDDFATAWQVVPRKTFEPTSSRFPRRFQVASGGISLGQQQFARKCSVCHTLKPNDRSRAGPTLYNLFGRSAGSVRGYPYSSALQTTKLTWNANTLDKLFDIGPHDYTPGSKMPLQRITDKRKRDALILYLKAATKPGKQ